MSRQSREPSSETTTYAALLQRIDELERDARSVAERQAIVDRD
jgi:hypothetical protein